MTPQAFAKLFDHTILKPDATCAMVEKTCAEALEFGFKGVCVNPCHIARVSKLLAGSDLLAMAVVGFPLGANLTAIKVAEAERAIKDGAGELDMVINIGAYLSGDKTFVQQDIKAVVKAAREAGDIPVKVIVETAFLSTEHIAELTNFCLAAEAAFIKTSTGFAARGASAEDIKTMAATIAKAKGKLQIKASGGIRNLAAARDMLAAGAHRLGASASVQILKDFEAGRV